MPLVHQETYNIDNKLAIWHVNENEDFFLNNVSLTTSESEILESFNNQQRRKEWLGIRHLLQNVLDIKSIIIYNEYGRPILENSPISISISHSKNLIGIYTSNNEAIGLDIELIHPKVEHISHKFLNTSEYGAISKIEKLQAVVLIWCAKEALLKIHGKKTIDFKSNLNILPFMVSEKGKINGQIIIDNKPTVTILNYFRFDNYFIVFGP